jgi:hypothetical protein
VLEIEVHVVKGLTELSQLVTEPVFPLKVKVPLDKPEQIVVPPETLPPTDAGLTVTIVSDEVAAVHEPF